MKTAVSEEVRADAHEDDDDESHDENQSIWISVATLLLSIPALIGA